MISYVQHNLFFLTNFQETHIFRTISHSDLPDCGHINKILDYLFVSYWNISIHTDDQTKS